MVTNIHFITGITGTGKTTVTSQLREQGCPVVQVGQEMRRRYPVGHFNGLGALDSTEPEVREILSDAIFKNDQSHLFVVGNPRTIEQVDWLMDEILPQLTNTAMHFHILIQPPAVIKDRLYRRDADADEERRNLNMQRYDNDRKTFYDIITHCNLRDQILLLWKDAPSFDDLTFYDKE